MRKVLILGASGLLGSQFYRVFKKLNSYDVCGTHSKYTKFTHLTQLDATDFIQVQNLIDNYRPNVIINCIGMTNLEMCTSNSDLAKKINTDLPIFVGSITEKKNSRFVQISTDNFVTKIGEIRNEFCKPIATNIYSETKLNADNEILKHNTNSLILRSNFFGRSSKDSGNSLLEWALHAFKNHQQVNGYINIKFNPVSTKTMVDITTQLLSRDLTGMINIGSRESLSKFEFLCKVQNFLDSTTILVKPSVYKKSVNSIDRPLNMVLDTSFLNKELGINPPPILDMIQAALNNNLRNIK
jgi:dTDP-4-dehydrorhamnose reductase